MPDALKITLSYKGPFVDDGTMPVEEVVDALTGFSGAYSKLAARAGSDVQHQLRVTAVSHSSFTIHVDALLILKDAAAYIDTLRTIAGAASWVIGLIVNAIAAKKHIKNKPYQVALEGDGNTVFLINADNARLSVSHDVLEILREKLIDSDLKKIVSPLREGEVESAVIMAKDPEGHEAKAEIGSKEREFFRPDETVETTREMEVTGTLISLNKESNRGTFKLGDERNIPYHYAGLHKDSFHIQFGNKGPVRARGEVTFDSNLVPIHIKISSITPLQDQLKFPEEHGVSDS